MLRQYIDAEQLTLTEQSFYKQLTKQRRKKNSVTQGLKFKDQNNMEMILEAQRRFFMGTTAKKVPIVRKLLILLSGKNGHLAKAILRRNGHNVSVINLSACFKLYGK